MAWMVEVPKVGVEVVQAKVVTAKVEFEVAADTNEFKMMMVDSATFQGIFTLM